MKEANRTYAGWIIIGSYAKRDGSDAKTFPLYSRLGDMLPIFATKKALLEYCRAKRIRLKGSIMQLRPARVSVECTLVDEPRT